MSSTIEIALPCGPIKASRIDDNLMHARGIPYATAKRFETPQPTHQWTNPIDCTTRAALCPQLPSRLESVMGPLTQGHSMDEDCLTVSVTAPENAKNAPVLVWLHGGAYISGGGDLDCYRPSGLAERGVVCVNVTYRLGVFGYLQIDGIAPANLGLLDQIAALRWIQSNVGVFGGDCGNVTVAGQSAGGDSIVCMMVAEGTSGLFHRAILMSPPLGELPGRTETETLLSEKAKSLLTKDPREMTTAELLELQKKLLLSPVQRRIMLFAPSFGAYPLPKEDELDQKILDAAKNIPILAGWTAHDGRPFASMIGPLCSQYRISYVGWFLEALGTWYMTRTYFSLPSQQLHERLVHAGCASTTYSFEWSAHDNPLKACHTIDVPFVLGCRDSWARAPMLQGRNVEDEISRLGEEVRNLLTAFVNGRRLKREHIAIGKDFVTSDSMFIDAYQMTGILRDIVKGSSNSGMKLVII
ncbi:Alpha/Beta hydrolase protein [Aspergillus ambiguus]|uniref:Alpha/Beta hydrolase protein n=1 Tax=Aspergillus ambiguus TaxID=176160 RepID=UPI003CCD14CE